MSIFWVCFTVLIVVLFGLDLLTAPKHSDVTPRANLKNLKQSRRPM